jgi:hypothetical protein
MAIKTRAEIKAETLIDLPDNTSGLISAGDVRGQLDDIVDSAIFPEDPVSSGTTVDTGQHYRIIMLSDGTVRAIPFDAVAPVPPSSVTGNVYLASVNVSWSEVVGATRYRVLRNGSAYATSELSSGRAYRDTGITVGQTYTYTVATFDQYQQQSPASTSSFVAFIDPALNTAPVGVVIKCWPNPLPTNGPGWVRVNAREPNVQDIAFALEVDVGSLTPTADPALWIIEV